MHRAKRNSLSALGVAAVTLSQEHGVAVFPCEVRGKRPHPTLAPHGFKDASSHPEQVAAWWDAAPDANIGLLPGSADWLVLDVDGPAGAATAAEFGLDRVETATVATSRGAHRYYALPRGLEIGNVSGLPGCDVRAHAGYVLAPPSIHPDGRVYAWTRGLEMIAPVPDALLARLTAPPVEAPPARPFTLAPSGVGAPAVRIARYLDTIGTVGEGQRNGTAFRVAAFALHDVGLAETDAGAVLAAWNAERCSPPLPTRELRTVLRSALRARGRAA